jgi:murein L,D-transpeptidase YcbB/YkuD
MKFSNLKYIAAGIMLIGIFGGPPNDSIAQSPELSLRELLRLRIEAGGMPLKFSIGNEPIYAAIVLPIFYERRGFQPAWSDINGPLPRTEALLEAIRQADREGLRSDDYHLEKIETILSEVRQKRDVGETPNLRQLVDLDLLLTDAFLICGAHLLAGRIDPEKIHPQWYANRREADLARLLEVAIGSNRIGETLAALLPDYAGYKRLREGLTIYRKIAETGWPTTPSGSKLQQGDRSGRIPILRRRLAAEGFLAVTANNDRELFDTELEQAIRKFQMHNGLEADGILGPQTMAALNITAEQRVRQIVVNMERWRWLPQNLGDRYILVNIAGFSLDVVDREKTVLTMRVVTGKTYRKTPVFSDKITYLVINPYWGVPDSIARKDILPKIRKEPNFLRKQKIRVLEGTGAGAKEIDPDQTNWANLATADLSYRFQQDPGPQNALGRIKFMFPNQFNVYLHDTPSKELFAKARRDFSSGCIRIEKPIEMAEYLLRNHPDWPPEKIRSTLTGSDFSTRTVELEKPVNIHILYWTARVDDEGHIHFQPDIYNRDTVLDAALQLPPPQPLK